jgi:fructokinase
MEKDNRVIICIGEILWDSLPPGLYLGGAPLNVSLHLHHLEQNTAIAGRVGNDSLGKEALRRIKNKGVLTDLIQVDETFETGFVAVHLDETGNPDYQIKEPVAWDYIAPDDVLFSRLKDAWGLVFGSLAQRSKISRKTIQRLFQCNCRKVFDINLRPPYIDRDIIRESLIAADILKMNESELHQLSKWFGLPGSTENAARTIAQKFDCSVIAITKASNGAALLYNDEWFQHQGYKIEARDAVGAGDAFTAALLTGIKSEKNGQEIIEYANIVGAYVASQNGAIPAYDQDTIEQLEWVNI